MRPKAGSICGAALRLAVLAMLLVGPIGCFWAAIGATCAGVAGYTYWKGKVCHAYAADLPNATAATKAAALAELGMTVSKEEAGNGTAVLKTRATDGTTVTIKLRRETSQVPSEGTITEVCVRVGAFGDHPLSGRILYQISSHLVPVPPPGTAPGSVPTASPGPLPPPPPPGTPTLPPPRALPPGTPPPPIAPAKWAPVKTGEPPLSR